MSSSSRSKNTQQAISEKLVKTYKPHFLLVVIGLLLDTKMEAICSFKTLVNFYQIARRNTQEVAAAYCTLVRKCQLRKGLCKYLLVSVLQ
jgi:hypothetical protein